MKKQIEFVNIFFYGRPNPTAEECRIYKEKMAAYMKAHGFDPEKVEWKHPADVLVEQDTIQRSN